MNDERIYEEKKPSLAGKVLRYIVYSFATFILGILFLRLLSTCEPGAAKKLYLDAQAERLMEDMNKDFKLYQVDVLDFITSDGLYYISFVYYLESANQLQITVRNKQANLADPKASEPLAYEISSQSGEISKGVYVNTEFRFNYRFDTIIFENVYIDMEAMQEDNTAAAGDEDVEYAGGPSVVLEILSENPRASINHLTVCNQHVTLKPKNIMNMKTIIR